MDDAQTTMHDKGRDGEFLLLYLTRAEVHYIARLARWQLARVEEDHDDLVARRTALPESDWRDECDSAMQELAVESDCIGFVLRECRAAWRRPTIVRDS